VQSEDFLQICVAAACLVLLDSEFSMLDSRFRLHGPG